MRVAKDDAHSASKTRVTALMAPPIYCAAMLLARMTSPQSLISRLSSELAASGVCWSGGNSSMPPSSNVLRTVASASAWRSAALSRSTIGPGVPAGANRMCQNPRSSFLACLRRGRDIRQPGELGFAEDGVSLELAGLDQRPDDRGRLATQVGVAC